MGRTDVLKRLLELLNPGETSGPNAVLVTGSPGVGKSALAWHAARESVRYGWFQRAAFFVDLQGYDPDPAKRLKPAHVYASLLWAFGIPPQEVPSEEGAAATVYHQLIARLSEQGQAVLLVLDNAADIDQVEPFLLTGGPHRVLIVSRDTFGQLASPSVLEIPPLNPDRALELLQVEARRRRPGDDRIMADPNASSALARLCGHLPLALQIVAALLSDEPNRSPAQLVEELNEESSRLRGLSYDERWGVRTAFDLSYFRLTRNLAQLFCMLPLIPGPSIGIDAAASLVNIQPSEARRQLTQLARAHLIEKTGTDRWRIHDLLRIYALDQPLSPQERDTAFERLIEHYREKTKAAAYITRPIRGQRISSPFKSNRAAEQWLDAERPALVNLVIQASADVRYLAAAIDLAYSLSKLLKWTRHVDDQLAVAEAVMQAGQHLGRAQEGLALGLLGQALFDVRRYGSAITAYQRAAKFLRKARDSQSEGIVLINLGATFTGYGQYKLALKACGRAIKIFRRTNCVQWYAEALQLQGEVWLGIGEFEKADLILKKALATFQRDGDLVGEAGALNDYSLVLRRTHRLDEAITARRQALAINEQVGDRWHQAMMLNNLGTALQYADQHEEASKAHRRAARVYVSLGDRYSEAKAVSNLCVSLRKLRRFDDAIDAGRSAVAILSDLGDYTLLAGAYSNLAAALSEADESDEAIMVLEGPIETFRRLNEKVALAKVLDCLGVVQMKRGEEDQARTSMMEALSIFMSIGAFEEAQITSFRLQLFLPD